MSTHSATADLSSLENIDVTLICPRFPGDGCDGVHRCDLLTLEGLQLQVFPGEWCCHR